MFAAVRSGHYIVTSQLWIPCLWCKGDPHRMPTGVGSQNEGDHVLNIEIDFSLGMALALFLRSIAGAYVKMKRGESWAT